MLYAHLLKRLCYYCRSIFLQNFNPYIPSDHLRPIFKTENVPVLTISHDFQSPNLGFLSWCIFITHFLLLPCMLEPWCIFKTLFLLLPCRLEPLCICKTMFVKTLLLPFEERTYSTLHVISLLLPCRLSVCTHHRIRNDRIEKPFKGRQYVYNLL